MIFYTDTYCCIQAIWMSGFLAADFAIISSSFSITPRKPPCQISFEWLFLYLYSVCTSLIMDDDKNWVTFKTRPNINFLMQSCLQVNTTAIEEGANGRAKSRYEENTDVLCGETYFITLLHSIAKSYTTSAHYTRFALEYKRWKENKIQLHWILLHCRCRNSLKDLVYRFVTEKEMHVYRFVREKEGKSRLDWKSQTVVQRKRNACMMSMFDVWFQFLLTSLDEGFTHSQHSCASSSTIASPILRSKGFSSNVRI